MAACVDTHVLPHRVLRRPHVRVSQTGYRNPCARLYHLYVRKPSPRPSVLPRDSHMGVPWAATCSPMVSMFREIQTGVSLVCHTCCKLFNLKRIICQRDRCTKLSVKYGSPMGPTTSPTIWENMKVKTLTGAYLIPGVWY